MFCFVCLSGFLVCLGGHVPFPPRAQGDTLLCVCTQAWQRSALPNTNAQTWACLFGPWGGSTSSFAHPCLAALNKPGIVVHSAFMVR